MTTSDAVTEIDNPIIATACYLGGFAAILYAPVLVEKYRIRRARKAQAKKLVGFILTLNDINNLPEVLED